jgi:drug/metabolite transporter (DMT)-like permease
MCLGAGAGFIAAACLAWGIDNNLTRKLAAVDPVVTTAIKGLVAGTVNATVALLRGARLPDAGTLATSGLVGFFGVGVSLVLFVMALRHLGTARTGAYFSLAPFIGALLSVLLLHEAFTINLALAGALMASGLWVHLAERHAHEHRHAALDHDHSHVHDEHHRHGHDGAAVPHAHRHTH